MAFRWLLLLTFTYVWLPLPSVGYRYLWSRVNEPRERRFFMSVTRIDQDWVGLGVR
jgi:hypothetical protein